MSGWFTSFLNCRLCRGGEVVEGEQLVVSDDSGDILYRTGYIGGDAVDLEDGIIAPGFLDLHANEMSGFDCKDLPDPTTTYAASIDHLAKSLPSGGVTGFYGTVSTSSTNDFHKILPCLAPREIPDGASLLGAHALLHCQPPTPNACPAELFAPQTPSDPLKLVTLPAHLPNSVAQVSHLVRDRKLRVSLSDPSGTTTYEQGLAALRAGATCLTHVPTTITALEPGLAGLAAGVPPAPAPFSTITADPRHVHPAVATMLFRASPARCILVSTDEEPSSSRAESRADLLLAGVRNLMRWSGCDVAQAVRCVTENVADLMGDGRRGKLESGRRADFVVLDDDANLLETWISGRKVWERR